MLGSATTLTPDAAASPVPRAQRPRGALVPWETKIHGVPGGDQHVLQEGLKGLFQALAGSGWLPLVEFGSNGGQECRNPKGLPVAAFMGFAAPLITEVTCQSFFPGLSVRVIAEGLDSEERRLATWPEQ